MNSRERRYDFIFDATGRRRNRFSRENRADVTTARDIQSDRRPTDLMQSRSQFREICRSDCDMRREEGRQKNRKKMQKFAVGHKCPNYLATGIRSTRRLYGRRHRNLSGRRNLRDGRANERPRHPFSPPRCPNSHSDAPNYPPSRLSPRLLQTSSPTPFCRPVSAKPIPFTSVFLSGRLTRDSPLENSPSSFEKIFNSVNKLSSLINQN